MDAGIHKHWRGSFETNAFDIYFLIKSNALIQILFFCRSIEDIDCQKCHNQYRFGNAPQTCSIHGSCLVSALAIAAIMASRRLSINLSLITQWHCCQIHSDLLQWTEVINEKMHFLSKVSRQVCMFCNIHMLDKSNQMHKRSFQIIVGQYDPL